MELNYRTRRLVITVVVSLVMMGIGLVSSDIGIFGNMVIISVLIVVAPQIIFSYEGYRSFKDLEANFPKLAINISESVRSGMPMPQAIIIASKYDYGKLTSEVKMMANQLSWKVNIERVLNQFAERVKKSRRLFISVMTIKEAYFAGGDLAATLDHVSSNMGILGEVEKERNSILKQYVVMMYALAMMFVAIVAAISKFMVPIFQITSDTGGQAILGGGNPCNDAGGLALTICNFYNIVASVFIKDVASVKGYYIALFFSMSLVEGIFSGMIAGQISEGSISAGLKHAVIMAVLVFGAFSIMVRIGFLG